MIWFAKHKPVVALLLLGAVAVGWHLYRKRGKSGPATDPYAAGYPVQQLPLTVNSPDGALASQGSSGLQGNKGSQGGTGTGSAPQVNALPNYLEMVDSPDLIHAGGPYASHTAPAFTRGLLHVKLPPPSTQWVPPPSQGPNIFFRPPGWRP